MIKILLLTDFSSGYSRSLLENVVRYAREVGPWAFYRMPLYFRELYGDEGVVEWAKKWGADAIIVHIWHPLGIRSQGITNTGTGHLTML